MGRVLALVALLGLVSVSSHAAGGPADVFGLLEGFAVKEACSCVFVVGQTDAYCNDFAQQPPYHETLTIDHAAKTVTVPTPTGMRVARYGAGGCLLDPLP